MRRQKSVKLSDKVIAMVSFGQVIAEQAENTDDQVEQARDAQVQQKT